MMKIKNWKDFQHFKDRCPPWIKLHRSILDQRDIATLSDSAFRVLVMLWLLASEDKKKQGNLPTVEDIAFRTRKPKEMISKNLQELCNFLISDDDTVMTERYRVGLPETEGEREEETEEEKEFKQLFSDLSLISGFDSEWVAWMDVRKRKKAAQTTHASVLIMRKLIQKKEKVVEALQMAIVSNWTGFEWAWFENSKGKSQANQKPSTYLAPDAGYMADLQERQRLSNERL